MKKYVGTLLIECDNEQRVRLRYGIMVSRASGW